jgi:hypothetical protein
MKCPPAHLDSDEDSAQGIRVNFGSGLTLDQVRVNLDSDEDSAQGDFLNLQNVNPLNVPADGYF